MEPRAEPQDGAALGSAVQVDPTKTKLKPPGTNRLKLKCDILLSDSALKFNLRRYTSVQALLSSPEPDDPQAGTDHHNLLSSHRMGIQAARRDKPKYACWRQLVGAVP